MKGNMITAAVTACMLFTVTCTGQEVQWKYDLKVAREEAKSASRPLLVFFSDAGVPGSQRMQGMLDSATVRTEITESLVAARVDMAKDREQASHLGVFRAGVVMLYKPDGSPLVRIDDAASPQELTSKLRSAQGKKPIPEPVPSGSAEPTSTPGIYATGTPAPTLRKGRLVAGPVIRHASDATPIELGKLESGKSYILVVAGEASAWSGATKVQDGLYIYNQPGKPNQLRLTAFVRFKDTDQYLYEYVMKSTGKIPVYNPAHIYEIVFPGNGKDLTLYFREKSAYNYRDNSGELKFTLFEAPR